MSNSTHWNKKIAVVLKDKSREQPGGGYKHSQHVMPELAGVPGEELKAVCKRILFPFKDMLRKPNFSGFTDEFLRGEDAPVIGVDTQPLGGNTPFSMLFSCKCRGDSQPGLAGRAFFSDGEAHVFPADSGLLNPVPFDPPPVACQHRLEDLSDAQAAELLRQSSCSIPTHYMLPISKKFVELGKDETQRFRASARPRSGASGEGPPSSGGGPGGARSSAPDRIPLPQWFRSYLDRTPGYNERRGRAHGYSQILPSLDVPVGDPSKWLAAHVDGGAVPCPTKLSMKIPELYSHPRNGVIVAWHPDMPGDVFARCTECLERDYTNEHSERVYLKNGNASVWIQFKREGFEFLVSDEGECRCCRFVFGAVLGGSGF